MKMQEAISYPLSENKSAQRRTNISVRLTKTMARFVYHIFLIPVALLMCFPFLWMISASLKSGDEVFTKPMSFIPETIQWQNYVNAWNSAPFDLFFMNSLFMSIGIVIGQVITCTLAAYAFSIIQFKGKQILFLLVLASMMIPQEATIIPSYLVVNHLKWLDTYYGLIVPGITSVFGIFLVRQFFLTLPKDYIEAARLEGASHWKIYRLIAMPMAKPVIATLCIFAFLNAYNSYMWPLLITTEVEMRTVQIGLRYLIDPELGTRWPELMAASSFVIIPVLALFVGLQRYFVKGVIGAGVKQ